VPKIFFWKNEAKLCPSLLGFSKKQSQIEPKKGPNEPTETQKMTRTNPIEPKL
jgi:hypothetical protein